MRSWKMLMGFGVMALGAVGCGSGSPHISDTTVTPNSFAISGFSDSAQFTIVTNVLDFTKPITSATASVEGQSSLQWDLTKQKDIAGGEAWGITTTLTLWHGISTGTYDIDVSATDSGGTTETQAKAATVTITD